MPSAAASFVVRGESPVRAARALESALSGVPRASAALLFLSGESSRHAEAVAKAIASERLGIPVLVACGAGVLTDRGEIEGEAAAAGLVWAGGRSQVLTVGGSNPDDVCARLATAIGQHADTQGTVLVFARPQGVAPHALEPLQGLRKLCVFGAGTVGEEDVFAIDASNSLQRGPAGAMIVHGLTRPQVRSSPACRLLMPLRRITETHGPMVLEVEGERALEVLSTVASDLVNQPLVFVVLSDETVGIGERAELLLRAVQGVDPTRHGLLVSEEVRPGMRMAFAVRDAAAARNDLEAVVRDLSRETAGAAPRFGIYLNCAGRGSGLHQMPDVDIRILRSRFSTLPIVGMQSSFEIAPHAGKPTLQLYTGVFGLFTSPS